MNIMKKRISLILSAIMLALVIIPIVNVAAATNTTYDVEVTVNGKELQAGSITQVEPGTKVTMTATPASKVTKLQYKLGDGDINTIVTSNKRTVTIPETAEVGETYTMRVSATYADGTSLNVEKYQFEIVGEKEDSTSYEKDVKVTVNGDVLKAGSTIEVEPGTKVTMTATPASKVTKLQYKLGDGDVNTIVTSNTRTVTIPETAEAGETYSLQVNATYEDGTSLDIEKYKFEIVGEEEDNTSYEKDVKVTVNGDVLKAGSTIEVEPGTKVTMTATPASKVTKLQYRLGDGDVNTIVTSNTRTVTIPETAEAGETYSLQVNATYEDGTSLDTEKYTFEVASGTSSETYEKDVKVTVNGKVLTAGSIVEVKPGTKVTMTATPASKVTKLQYKLGNGDVNTIATSNTRTVQIPTTAKVGETYTLQVNATYVDGVSTIIEKYKFEIAEEDFVSDDRDLDIETWMEENDEIEELAISLRNDSEVEDKANKNIYELGEKVTYYIDYKNGGKDIDDDVTITLELPLDFDAIDLDGGKVNSDDEIEWVFEDGLEEGESGTIIVEVEYTDLKKSRDDANTIYPVASIYKGSKVKDVSAVVNFIITEYDEELDIEHEPYMFGDANSDTFRPDYVITRAEGALVLARIYGLDYKNVKTITTKYTDINTTYEEAQKAITAASNAGLINGYLEDNGTYTYRPNEKMTKAEFMKILACMVQEAAEDEDIDGLQIKELDQLIKNYDDSKRYYMVNGERVYMHWAIEEISLLARLNMLPVGSNYEEFELDEKITRAEVAQLINFYLLRAPAEVDSKTKTGFDDVSRKHNLVGDIIEATRDAHTFSITTDGTEVEE